MVVIDLQHKWTNGEDSTRITILSACEAWILFLNTTGKLSLVYAPLIDFLFRLMNDGLNTSSRDRTVFLAAANCVTMVCLIHFGNDLSFPFFFSL